jgi:hypothetical protein
VKIPTSKSLLRFNAHLKRTSHENYLALLRRVFQDHEHHDFVKPLLGFLRSRRYDLLWRYADSLSAETYSDASVHLLANQLSALIRKYPWNPKDVSLDPERTARDTFLRAERRCSRLNSKFQLLASGRSPREDFLSRVRSFISYVLGDEPDITKVYDLADFGPGANLGVHGDATSFGRKITAERLTVTPGARADAAFALARHYQLRQRFYGDGVGRDWLMQCFDEDAASQRFLQDCSLVQNNKVSFVPKTARTFRSIAVEPLLNSFLQKGVDQVMRLRLLRIGLNLRDQSKNCSMAREGSMDGSSEGFCTIDLSSASDSISIGLVRNILPYKWFFFLNRLRSPSYDFGDGTFYRYHKFCSMGNGFCFPLQTLIFAAIAFASNAGKCGRDFRVYGDDIIVRRLSYEETVRNLRYCGFSINKSKTFADGPFRESCGSDWYSGTDVRPYTLDHKLDSLQSLFKFLNLSRRSHLTSMALSGGIDEVLSLIPIEFRFWRPFPGNPDSGIDSIDYDSRYSKYARVKKSLHCYEWLELVSRPLADRVEVPFWGVYAAALRGHESSHMFSFRRRTKMSMRFVSHSGSKSTWIPTNRVW